MTDPIADMLTVLRNGYAASKEEVIIPFSKLKKNLADKLQSVGYLESVSEEKIGDRKVIRVNLRYEKGQPEIQGIKRISKPGLRIYRTKTKIPYVLGGLGYAILSTSQGLLTDKEARQKKIGGEVICEVW